MKITIGQTQSDRGPGGSGYSSFDGYLPGAAQEVFEIEVPDAALSGLDAEGIAWAHYRATNAPSPAYYIGSAAPTAIEAAVRDLRKTRLRAFSQGDTITVLDQTLTLQESGFVVVEIAPADPERLKVEFEKFWEAKRLEQAWRSIEKD